MALCGRPGGPAASAGNILPVYRPSTPVRAISPQGFVDGDMKISGPSKSNAATGARRASGSSGASKGFHVASAPEASAAHSAAATASVDMLGALINLQSQSSGRRAMIEAGEETIALLEEMQRDLLDGAVSVENLEAIVDASSSFDRAPADGSDARLAAIYNDIVLRARVELAKLGR